MRFILVMILLIYFVTLTEAQSAPKITIYNASDFINTEGTVCDSVYSVSQPAGENKPIYLNFGGNYPDNIFSAIIFAKDQYKFNFDLKEVLKNKNVCVTGKITQYKGNHQIIVNDAVQLLIQE
ncbi:MAG: hypothetical protein IPN86_22815 [Saprospiraceae bacterium]|nr:hypothetical protein [Saprospiraceae bacterium]